jgi:enoyl-CoA hydratase/3-hydroxyacyl-CoA dehydrogenase
MLKNCGFVVEAIRERLEDKKELMKKLETIVGDDCIIATNTSSFTPSEISEGMRKPERVTLFHFSNPPILMELIEVGGEGVSEDVVGKTVEIARKIGKKPVVIRKECRGHILNRMLGASGVGAAYVFMDARPEEVDVAIKNLGSPRGFFELFDLIGIDVILDVLESFREVYGEKFSLPKGMQFFLEKMTEWGKLGKKSGEGFYRWEEGKPLVREAEPCNIMPVVAAIVNEAFKIVEDGIGDEETVNEVYKIATGSPVGVFDVAELLGYQTIVSSLEELYEKTGREVFRPAETLKQRGV